MKDIGGKLAFYFLVCGAIHLVGCSSSRAITFNEPFIRIRDAKPDNLELLVFIHHQDSVMIDRRLMPSGFPVKKKEVNEIEIRRAPVCFEYLDRCYYNSIEFRMKKRHWSLMVDRLRAE